MEEWGLDETQVKIGTCNVQGGKEMEGVANALEKEEAKGEYEDARKSTEVEVKVE